MCPSEAARQSMFPVASFIHIVCLYLNLKAGADLENNVWGGMGSMRGGNTNASPHA